MKLSNILRIAGLVIALGCVIAGVWTEIGWLDSETIIERVGLSAAAVVVFGVFFVLICAGHLKDLATRYKWAKIPKSPLLFCAILLIVLLAVRNVIDPMINVTIFATIGTAVDVALRKTADLLDYSAELKKGGATDGT